MWLPGSFGGRSRCMHVYISEGERSCGAYLSSAPDFWNIFIPTLFTNLILKPYLYKHLVPQFLNLSWIWTYWVFSWSGKSLHRGSTFAAVYFNYHRNTCYLLSKFLLFLPTKYKHLYIYIYIYILMKIWRSCVDNSLLNLPYFLQSLKTWQPINNRTRTSHQNDSTEDC